MPGDDLTRQVATLHPRRKAALLGASVFFSVVAVFVLIFTSKESDAVTTLFVISAILLVLWVFDLVPAKISGGGVGVEFLDRSMRDKT